MTRAELTEKIAVLKRKRGLSWNAIAAELGPGSPVYYTAALLGQMKL
jgi:cyanate lyase